MLSVPSGPWHPPDRDALGAETVALVVLDGLLVADTAPDRVLGPGDVVVPWDPRVPLDGLHAVAPRGARERRSGVPLRAWPAAAARLLARASAAIGSRGARGRRRSGCSTLLWRIAARWGVPHGDAVALPRALDVRAVSALLELSEADVTRRWARLASRGTLGGATARGGSCAPVRTTRVASGHSRERRDQLRARGAEQLALARAIGAEHDAMIQQPGSATRAQPAPRRLTVSALTAPHLVECALGSVAHRESAVPDPFPPKRLPLRPRGRRRRYRSQSGPAGELDMATVDQLEECLREAHGRGLPPHRRRPARARVHGLDRPHPSHALDAQRAARRLRVRRRARRTSRSGDCSS